MFNTLKGSQIIGLAVRKDSVKFEEMPFERFHIGEGQGGAGELLSQATLPFLLDTDDDELKEQHRFERLPLYAEIKLTNNKIFRILGLHLKSKAVVGSYEWAKWWSKSDANRKKILAQCQQLRRHFLDRYLSDPETRDIPLVVCGDINDGPGMDANEQRLNSSGVERLMGDVWKPQLSLGNALFDALSEEDQFDIDLEEIYTTSFRDPLFRNYRKVWIDHILYTRNIPDKWVFGAESKRVFGKDGDGKDAMIWRKYPHASDHHPVIAKIEL